MRIVITGGRGFLGRHVVDLLLCQGHEVVVLSRSGSPAAGAVETLACDVTRDELPEALRGCDALVHLVGIKREDGEQTFERVHVDATRLLLDAARRLAIGRFIHVSVVCSRPHPSSGYHDTKWRAEELVRESGLDFTILKPGVIYGRGDDMLTQLVKMIRFTPVFPVVGRGDSLLQPVSAAEVAGVIAQCLERHVAVGKTYDVVGPRPLPLREVVRRVAQGLSLRTWIVPTPIWFQRIAARLMNALLRNPPTTPAQLEMLIDGMDGDPTPVRDDLEIETAELSADIVGQLEAPIAPLFGVSLRLVDSRPAAEWVRSHTRASGRSIALIVLAAAVLVFACTQWTSIWYRMAAVYALMIPAAVALSGLRFKELLAPRLGHVVRGVAAAACFYAVARVGFSILVGLFPSLAEQAVELRLWRDQVGVATAVTLLVLLLVPGEEILWRGAITLPLAARWGPWSGCLLGGALFSGFHVLVGPPLLLIAAFAAGTFWSWLALKSRSLVPPLVCHVLWDLTVIYSLPL